MSVLLVQFCYMQFSYGQSVDILHAQMNEVVIVKGLDVTGIELDKSWWHSKYSPPLFLDDIIFIDENRVENFEISSQYAILFCYFNNGEAFCNYIENYKGNLVFVVGPSRGQMRSTDPMPFDEKFISRRWKLLKTKEILHSNDCITVYNKL